MTLWRRAARVVGARMFHWAENNGQSAFGRNGEQWLLDSLLTEWAKDPLPNQTSRLILDVGANVGDYTAAVLERADRLRCKVQVHAFEPGPASRSALHERFASDFRVKVVGAAVADQPGELRLYSDAPGSSQASLINRSQLKEERGELVEVIRLEDYLHEEGLKRVDLLKLDVEGAELAGLRGLGALLNPEVVPLIQFEYGGATLDAGNRLRDFFILLEQRDYVVAKLLPDALVLRPYDPWMDHFWYSNYVALKRPADASGT